MTPKKQQVDPAHHERGLQLSRLRGTLGYDIDELTRHVDHFARLCCHKFLHILVRKGEFFDFFGTGVATWRTWNVELYLSQ